MSTNRPDRNRWILLLPLFNQFTLTAFNWLGGFSCHFESLDIFFLFVQNFMVAEVSAVDAELQL